jgi:hypothetical protein
VLNRIAATLHVFGVTAREKYQQRIEREPETGMETLQVVILTAIGVAIAIALAAIIKNVYDKYAGQISGW